MKLLVCIPTVSGREEYLKRACCGYAWRTPGVDVYIETVYDAPSCGEGWQQAVERGLDKVRPDYIHFGNDDVVVGQNWFEPLREAVDAGDIPAPRIEPAGFHLGEDDPVSMPPLYVDRSVHSYFYADLPENQPTADYQEVDHGALPFCSLDQWHEIGPFIPIHFGTDKWFYLQAKRNHMKVVARMHSVIFNYAAQCGRSKGDWTEIDFLDFDLTVAYPEYESGSLGPDDKHPERLTPKGLERVRRWREKSFDPPYHWESK